jgi:hypothetical protein
MGDEVGTGTLTRRAGQLCIHFHNGVQGGE